MDTLASVAHPNNESVGEQEFADGKKTPQNLAILMNWQKQGSEWKLLSRSATKL